MTIYLPPEIPEAVDQPPAIISTQKSALPSDLASHASGIIEPNSIAPPESFSPEFLPLKRSVSLPEPGAVQTHLLTPQLTESSLKSESENEADDALAQVASVSQFSDVQPTDWAFQALQSLVERYGCLEGYPDRSFRGNRALTRYEFAAGLNACLSRVNELVSASTSDLIQKSDLITLQRLQEEFSAELATLRGRVDTLEARTTTLEKQQFSTTTVLRGQSIFAIAAAAGGDPPGRGEKHPIFVNLTQLQLASSFSGRDLLRVGLATGNAANEGFANFRSLNTNMALLSYQTDQQSQFELNALDYRFAVGERIVLTLQPVGFSLNSVLSANSSYTDAGTGAVSRFAALNPVFRIGNVDAGAGFDWLLSDKWRLQFAYGTRNTNNPGAGLFGSDHRVMGMQVLLKPNPSIVAGLAYVNAYARDGQLDTLTGSNNADISGGFNERTTIHALSATLRWRLSPKVTLGAWGGAIVALSRQSDAATLTSTYLVSLGIDDPFRRQGDQLAFLVGQPPKLNIGFDIERADDGNSLHFETFYRFRVSDRISISPGFFYVTNAGHITENNDIFVGTIRTTFNF